MSIILRILLILASLLASISVIRKIRKAKLQIDDEVFWVLSSIIILLVAIFPNIIYILADITGVQSPANLLYLLVIAILLMKIFNMSIKISILEDKIKKIVQKISLDE